MRKMQESLKIRKYQNRYSGLVKRYDTAKEKYDELNYKIEQKRAQNEKMTIFIESLKKRTGILTEFDSGLWSSLVEFVTVGKKNRSVTFKDGTTITV